MKRITINNKNSILEEINLLYEETLIRIIKIMKQ